MATNVLDVLVIGAGQAGLALGYQLKQTGQEFLLVDKHDRLGESWRQRFDSLTLFTPRSYSALPGLPVPGDPDGYPTKDEIADYLETLRQPLRSARRAGNGDHSARARRGLFLATDRGGTELTSRAVVLATGAFQQPAIPALGGEPRGRRRAAHAGDVPQPAADARRNRACRRRRRDRPPDRAGVERDPSGPPLHWPSPQGQSAPRPRQERLLVDGQARYPDQVARLRIGRKLKEKDPFPGKDLALDKLRAQASPSRAVERGRGTPGFVRGRAIGRDRRGDLGDRVSGREQLGGDPGVVR